MNTTTHNNFSQQRKKPAPSGSRPAPEYGELQKLVDDLYKVNPSKAVARIDIIVQAEVSDLSDDLMEVIRLLPSGTYRRSRLCDHLNSIMSAHGWSYVYGNVE